MKEKKLRGYSEILHWLCKFQDGEREEEGENNDF
jgi:hypothetical protein